MEYIKLSEVTLLTGANTEPNILAEVDGEVVRVPASEVAASQIKADWNEEDPNSPAYILNKPDISEGSGGASVILYETASGSLIFNGNTVTRQEVVDAWNSGAIIRIGNDMWIGNVMSLNYTMGSGSIGSVTISYCNNGSIEKISI